MVNTTARHESTGMNGKIQCSSVLYEHLAEYSANSEGPMYDFTARGYVDMKGKGRCYTYWLDRGSKHNKVARPSAIKELKTEVDVVLSKKKWRKRKYFDFRRRRSSIVAMSDNGDTITVGTDASGLFNDDPSLVKASKAGEDQQSEHSASGVDMGSVDGTEAASTMVSIAADARSSAVGASSNEGMSELSDHDTVSFAQLKKTPWSDIKWDPNLSRIDLVAAIHGLLSSMLWKCAAGVLPELPPNKSILDHELLRFVDRVSTLYEDHPFHSWDHACQVVLSATYLIKEYDKAKDDIGGPIENNPFIRFITVFAALIHDVKHLGVPNAQLREEGHPLTVVYCQGSYQERQSIQIALGVFIEEFPELSTAILRLCPLFLHLVTSAVLATDVASPDIQSKIRTRFERVVIIQDEDVTELDKTLAVVEQILLLADVGHCSQGYDNFLNWNGSFFHECLNDYHEGRGNDPRPGWHEGQLGFLEGYILPLAERCNALIPQCQLTKGTRRILRLWKKDGKEWTDKIIEQSRKAEKTQNERQMPTSSSTQSSAGGKGLRRFSLFQKKNKKEGTSRAKAVPEEIQESSPIKRSSAANGTTSRVSSDDRALFYDDDLENW